MILENNIVCFSQNTSEILTDDLSRDAYYICGRHIRSGPASLPALLREGTVLTAGRTKGERKRFGRLRERGTALVSTVRREINTSCFNSCCICHRIGAEKCRPVVSLARAGPSRPGRCWSTTQRSYLMTIAPPLEALYSLPLLEVMPFNF